jgi:hypothetical protein
MGLHTTELVAIAFLALLMPGRIADWSDRALGVMQEKTRQSRLAYLIAFLQRLLRSVFKRVSPLGRAVRFEPRPGERICPACDHFVRPAQLLSGSLACPVCGHYLPE